MFDDQVRWAEGGHNAPATSDAAWWAQFDEFGDEWAAAAAADESDDEAWVSLAVDDAEVAALVAMEPGASLGAALASFDPAQLSDFDLVDYVKAIERQRRHLDGVLAATLAELAHRPVFAQCADTGVIGEAGGSWAGGARFPVGRG